MNEFINTSIKNTAAQMKVGIMNAMHEMLRENIVKMELGNNIPYSTILDCLKELEIPFIEEHLYWTTIINCGFKITHDMKTGHTIFEKSENKILKVTINKKVDSNISDNNVTKYLSSLIDDGWKIENFTLV